MVLKQLFFACSTCKAGFSIVQYFGNHPNARLSGRNQRLAAHQSFVFENIYHSTLVSLMDEQDIDYTVKTLAAAIKTIIRKPEGQAVVA